MSEFPTHPVPANFKDAHINAEQYKAMYEKSVSDPAGFWGEQAEKYLTWFKKWDKTLDWSFGDDVHIKWFEGGKLNVSYNCVDRHVEGGDDGLAGPAS